jgi:hypothetical protein
MADYIPTEDIKGTTADGREYLIAAAGVPVPEARAKELGLIKESQPQGPSETKAEEPTKTKEGASGEPQLGEQPPNQESLGTEPDENDTPLPVGKQAKKS